MKNFGAYSIQEFCSSSFFDSKSLKAIYALNQTNAPEVGFLDSVEYLKELIEKSYINFCVKNNSCTSLASFKSESIRDFCKRRFMASEFFIAIAACSASELIKEKSI